MELTQAMSSETHPTKNLVVPYCTSLFKELENVKAQTQCGKLFLSHLLKQTKKRLLPYKKNTIARYVGII